MSTADPTNEKDIQRLAIQHAERLGIQCIRLVFRPGLRAGWPDVLFLIPGGKPLFIEFKSRSKSPTPLQERRLRELWDAGYDCLWCDSLQDAIRTINEVMDHARQI